jgi:predicted amidophosphoribosyltransferase
MRIPGRWRDGFALDNHTVSSTYLGDDEFGHPTFDTKRSEIGELLYRLKYQSDQSVIAEIVEAAAAFIATWSPGVQIVVPVPASRARAVQPVLLLGDALAKRLGLPFVSDAIAKAREVPELKNVHDYNERIQLLAGAHAVDRAKVQTLRVLLFDDLYRSGATMNAISAALYDHGGAADVFALTITKTRSKS